MFSYTKRNVYTISLIISIIIFILLNYLWINIDKINSNFEISSKQIQENIYENNIEENKIENKVESIEKSTEEAETIKTNKYNWEIEIPEIDLLAEIAEGTTKEVMNKYVGHFEETSKTNGNIGLIAHNRGYPVNYFQNIKKLQKGDEVIYRCEDFEMTYIIDTIEIIEDTDWSYLEETEENRITLITCVENQPEYRRCIQGIEKEIESEEI